MLGAWIMPSDGSLQKAAADEHARLAKERREKFTAVALEGLLASGIYDVQGDGVIARAATNIADAVIAELDK